MKVILRPTLKDMWLILMFFMFHSTYETIKDKNPLEAVINTPIALAEAPESTINDFIVEYSKTYNVPEKTLNRVIKAESNYDCEAKGDHGKANGISQFHKPTFEWLSKKEGEQLDYNSCQDQIKLLAWSIANGFGKHWTTY